jgi:FeS assembly SUF system protein
MTDPTKKISLIQSTTPEDHAAKIMREKIGDLSSLPSTPAHQVITGANLAPDQKQLEEKIIDTLRTIFDPEIPLNIYDLGLIYKLTLDPANAVAVDMTLTAPGCPVAGSIVAEVKRKIEALPEVPRVTVTLVWDPPWTRDRLSEAARLDLGLM